LNEALNDPGFTILVGDSGVGKTAIVEEYATRIVKGQIPNLVGARMIRFNLRDAAGGVGLKAIFNDIVFGGLETSIRYLLQNMEKSSDKGKTVILFIDEIQELLSRNPTIFDPFKEELSRGRLKIIGATTDQNIVHTLRNRRGSGAGMLRRIEEIHVLPMSKEATTAVIQQQARDLAVEYRQKGMEFEFRNDFYEAIVILSQEIFKQVPLPNCASTLLSRICLHHFNHRVPRLGAEEVIAYVAQRTNQRAEEIRRRLLIQQMPLRDAITFRQDFFPHRRPVRETTEYIEAESSRLLPVLLNNPDRPWMVLSGESKQLQMDIVADWSKKGHTVYRCDLMRLVRMANNVDGLKMLKLFTREEGSILILENFNPAWGTVLQTPPPVVPNLVHSIENSQMGQMAQRGLRQLGIDTREITSSISAATTTLSSEDSPEIVAALLKMIKSEKIPAVIVQSGGEPISLPAETWKSRPLRPLKLDEMVEWLSAKGSEADKAWIATVSFALYNLCPEPGNVLDLAARVVALAAKEKVLDHINTVLDGLRTREEIQQAWALAQQQKEMHAFDGVDGSIECPEALRGRLHYLMSSSPSSILYVVEDSTARRQSLANQIAKGLLPLGQTAIHLNYRQMKGMAAPLKGKLIEKQLSMFKNAPVVIIEEEVLKDPAVMQQLGGFHLVCFRAAQKVQPSADRTFLGHLFHQGVDIVKQQMAVPSVGGFEYIPGKITEQELQLLISQRLKDAAVPAAVRPALQNLYVYLAQQPRTSLDQVVEGLTKDLKVYDLSSGEKICEQFNTFYGADLGISLSGIKYEVSPQMTSWVYRTVRGVVWAGSIALFYLTYPIRQAIWLISAVASTLLGSTFGWARRRIIGV
jgi:hypothetical protein